jgi:hypothetical protein
MVGNMQHTPNHELDEIVVKIFLINLTDRRNVFGL